MNRDETLREKRKQFIKLTDKDPIKAAQELTEMAKALTNCRKSADKIFALSQIFCVSESTIEKDLYADN